jgi:precorrin-4/cobalt-precorrin-4 C11-methyltransferase
MTQVYFIGAGPGDPDLITVKGRDLIARADLVLYAGSLVPPEAVACARPGARVEDSAPLTLAETHALLMDTVRAGGLAVRVHTGDPSLYGAVAEQAALLDAEGVAWEIVPGVTAAFAAAAMAGVGFTVPGATQSLVITRAPGRTPVPEAEALRAFAARGCSLAVYLSATLAGEVRRELLAGGLAPQTCVVAGHRVGWPDGAVLRTTVDGLAEAVAGQGWGEQVVFLVLPGQDRAGTPSRLYAPDFAHGRRGHGGPPDGPPDQGA